MKVRKLSEQAKDNAGSIDEVGEKLKSALGYKPIGILIPMHNSASTLHRALSSIAMQSIIDKIKVYCVDDSSEKAENDKENEIINSFKNYIDIEYCGQVAFSCVGKARNYLLDFCTKCEYIYFLDADDMLYTTYALEPLYNLIRADIRYTVIEGNFYEETYINNGQKQLIPHGSNPVFIHAKLYRYDFLRNNNIRFSETQYNEDAYFNQMCEASGGIKVTIEPDKITSIWTKNPNSLTNNSNRNTAFNQYRGYMNNQILLFKEKKRRNILMTEQSISQTICTLAMSYVYLNAVIDKYSPDENYTENFFCLCRDFYKLFISISGNFNYEKQVLPKVLHVLSNCDELKCFIPCISWNDFLIKLEENL